MDKEFVRIPNKCSKQKETFEDSNLEGYRLIDLKDLQNVVRNHFSCTSCINNALDSYLELFFQYTVNYMNDFTSQASNMKNQSEKITFYEEKLCQQTFQHFMNLNICNH